MKHAMKALFAAFIFGTGGTALLPYSAPALAQASATQVAAKEQTQIFVIDNMTCPACPITVRKAMEGVAGVKSVKVDFKAKTATVVYDPSSTMVDAIAAASANAGYPARPAG